MDLKKAKLSDDAAIYNQGPEKTEKQKWAEMNGKQRFDFFKTYYLKYVIVGILVLLFLAYVIYTIVKPKATILANVAVNNFTYVDFTKVADEYLAAKELSSKDFTISFDTAYSLEDDYTSIQRFAVYVYAGDLDMFVSANGIFERYATQGFMIPVKDYLPEDLYNELDAAGLLYYASVAKTEYDGTVSSIGERMAYGINLKELIVFKDFSYEGNMPIIGIMQNSKNIENSVDIITFMLESYKQ